MVNIQPNTAATDSLFLRYKEKPRSIKFDGNQVECVWDNGATYQGRWADNLPHGEGKYVLPREGGFTYEGGFVKGARSGTGTCIFADGREYKGEWDHDEMHGMGVLHGVEGIDDFVEYEGPFVHGNRCGAGGVCRYRDGSVYKGDWASDKCHGQGELDVCKSIQVPWYQPIVGEAHVVKYKGSFVEGIPRGNGVLTYSDNSSYTGECEGLHRNGQGEHVLFNKDVFKGSFKRDLRHGPGVLTSSCGEFRGEWKDGHLGGRIVAQGEKILWTEVTAKYYCGPCVRGEMTGEDATLGYKDGSTYSGPVRSGKPSGVGVLSNKPVTIPGVGEFVLNYEGEFASGVAKGEGKGTFTLVKPASPSRPAEPADVEVCRIIPKYTVSGYYQGSWANSKPEGQGEWVWEKIGCTYTGSVQNFLPHGEGTLSSTTISYTGGFVGGLPDGKGCATWVAGPTSENKYEGEWKNGYAEGDGLQKLHNGSTYQGKWVKGLKDGEGTENVPCKHKYTGGFERGRKHGKGKLYLVRTGEVCEGDFVQGAMTGNGKITTKEGHIIQGQFLNGKLNGDGEVRDRNGVIFRGCYKNGIVVGNGTLLYTHGDVYEGGVVDSGDLMPLRDGKGVYTFLEGGKLECCWKRNVLTGEGFYTSSNGTQSRRTYVEGILESEELIGGADNPMASDHSVALSSFTTSDDGSKNRCSLSQGVVVRRSLPVRGSIDPFPRRTSSQSGRAESVAPADKTSVPLPMLNGQPRNTEKAAADSDYSTPKEPAANGGKSNPSFAGRVSLSVMTIADRKVSCSFPSVDSMLTITKGTTRDPGCASRQLGSSKSQSSDGVHLSERGSVASDDSSGRGSDFWHQDSAEAKIKGLTEKLQKVNEQIRLLKSKKVSISTPDGVGKGKGDPASNLAKLEEERRSMLQGLLHLV